MAEPAVSRLSKDIILKRLVDGLRGEFLARFGLHLAPIVAALPTELPVLTVRAQRTDLLFLLEDGTILHLEFQTTKKPADLLRFAFYNLEVHAHYGNRVYTIILHGPGIASAPSVRDSGSNVFTVRNLLLGMEDGDAILKRLQEKQAGGEPFTATDRLDIVLLPLMRHTDPLESVLTDIADVARTLPIDQQEQTIGALVGMAYHYVDEATSEKLLEALRMTNALEAFLEEGIAKGIAQGIEQGKELGIRQGIQQGIQQGEALGERKLLRKLLDQRFGAIPDSLDQRIEQADAETLTSLFERAMAAESIAALDGE
jgi:hypothetical protein